jgi:predicted alpha/beta hydrolase family esterase
MNQSTTQTTDTSKAIANQIARLSLAGHIVHKGGFGDFTVCKYGLTRYCADFTELVAFAVNLGVNHV